MIKKENKNLLMDQTNMINKEENEMSTKENMVEAPTTKKFDLEKYKLSQNFSEQIGVKKELLTIPVRKPNRQDFIMVNPDPNYQNQVAVLELKDDRETYLVNPSIISEVSSEVVIKLLLTAINRQGVLFIWPIKLPSPDGKLDNWSQAAIEASKLAMDKWVRVVPNMNAGFYEVYTANKEIPGPIWPETPFEQLIEIAFKGKIIDTLDHPVLKKLRGEY